MVVHGTCSSTTLLMAPSSWCILLQLPAVYVLKHSVSGFVPSLPASERTYSGAFATDADSEIRPIVTTEKLGNINKIMNGLNVNGITKRKGLVPVGRRLNRMILLISLQHEQRMM
ncbi:hypothetical protein BC628DRAFT_12419 [Trametes gibbosa]|nr:hypothetical protein BC628DRAFT_12419 [Trametes gibbosa]